MSQLNESVSEFAQWWTELVKEHEAKELEAMLPKDAFKQLDAYVNELENYNEEIDVDQIISEIEDARSQLEDLESTLQDAINNLDNAVSTVEDLR